MPISAPQEYLCGIDAGASKTDCAIATLTGELLARTVSGPAAMNVGPGFADAIFTALAECTNKANIDPDSIRTVAVGLAGVDNSASRSSAVSALASVIPGAAIVVDNDASIALKASTAHRPAAVVMAGTGSIVFGESRDGTRHRVGGWGHILDDEGSGYAIAIAALSAALRAVERRGRQTVLGTEACRYFGLQDVRQLVDLTWRFAAAPGFAAGFAPKVIAASEHDDVAADIVAAAAEELADQANVLIDEIRLTAGDVVALGGGLLANPSRYVGLVVTGIHRGRPELRVGPCELPPVGGAILAAAESLTGSPGPPGFRAVLSDALSGPIHPHAELHDMGRIPETEVEAQRLM